MLRTIRRLRVRHTTRYTYERPVQRSSHRVHLRPIDDWKQTVISHDLAISPETSLIEYEDVFGNWSTRFAIDRSYTELMIAADSIVELLDVDPFAFARTPIRPS